MTCFRIKKVILHYKNKRKVAGCILSKVMAVHIRRLGNNTDDRNVIRIRGGLNFLTIFINNYAMSIKAPLKILPMLRDYALRKRFGGLIKRKYDLILSIQERFNIQSAQEKKRMGYLTHYWNEELKVYAQEMRKRKHHGDRHLYRKIKAFKDFNLLKTFLTAYMDQCKKYNSFAFFQF